MNSYNLYFELLMKITFQRDELQGIEEFSPHGTFLLVGKKGELCLTNKKWEMSDILFKLI